MDRNDLPLGFAFALAQRPEAMQAFSNLPATEQSEILQKAHNVSSKAEMQSLVNSLSSPTKQVLERQETGKEAHVKPTAV